MLIHLWNAQITKLVGLGAVVVVLALGCGGSPDDNPVKPVGNVTLVLLNWDDYIDVSVLKDFEKETGIRIKLEEYGQSAELISKIQSQPSAYDVIIADNTTTPFLGKARLLKELDFAQLPNFKHIAREHKNPFFDPENKYTVPYAWGTTGLGVNTRFVNEEVTSWNVLLKDTYKGKTGLFDDPREVAAVLFGMIGESINTTDPSVVDRVIPLLEILKKNETMFADYVPLSQELISGEKWLVMAYSGDLLKIAQKHPHIKYVVPTSGGYKWVDSYAISRHTKHPHAAYAFVNFMLRPRIAARISNSQHYASPNKDALQYISPVIVNNKIIYPPKSVLERCEYLLDTGKMNNEYTRLYAMLK
jgi:spermidine/putrescine transport system substrate-binding protein